MLSDPQRRVLISRLLLLAFVTIFPRAVFAQVFAGGGIFFGPDTTDAKLLLASHGPCSTGPIVEAGVFITRHVGIGSEWLHCNSIDEGYGGLVSTHAMEAEDVITLSLRARVPLSARLSLQALAGAGAIHSDITEEYQDAFPTPSVVRTYFNATTTKLAVLGGVDLLITVFPHLSVGPSLRVYDLRRPPDRAGAPNVWTSILPGLLVRATW